MGLLDNFQKNIKTAEEKEKIPSSDGTNIIADISNWYSDRYGTVLIQRNILFLLLIASIIVVVLAVFKVSSVSSLYTVKPFVIEIEDKTGLTNVVNPLAKRELISNESLNQYFIMQYIRSREGYCSTDYKYNYTTVVRLLSSATVYRDFRNLLTSDPRSPITLYGEHTCTTTKLRSIQFFKEIDKEKKIEINTAVVRFTVVNISGPQEVKQHKIASLKYEYSQMELSLQEREINPLGFQVLNYRVDDEIVKD